MDTVKQTYRNVETGTKKAIREVDGHDVGDDIANLGDEVKKNLGNAGDTIRREAGEAADDVRRHTDDPRS
jgi:hypothetical protein